jgi:hypothetical protein
MKSIIIVVLTIFLIVGGILFWQYFGITEQEMEEPGKEVKMLTNDWVGTYEYGEFALGVAASNQIWSYDLEIYEKENKLKARLNIDGHMTLVRIQAVTKERGGNLDIFFDSHLSEDSSLVCKKSENSFVSCEKGDLLFTLEMISDKEYRILWNKMKSNLLEPGDARFKKILPEEDVFEEDEILEENVSDAGKIEEDNNIKMKKEERVDVSSIALDLEKIPEDFDIDKKEPQTISDVNDEAVELGWKEGYKISYIKEDAFSGAIKINIFISRYPLENISQTTADFLPIFREGVVVEKLPDPRIGEGGGAVRLTDEILGLSYIVEFYKKDIHVGLSAWGTESDYELLIDIAREIEDRI